MHLKDSSLIRVLVVFIIAIASGKRLIKARERTRIFKTDGATDGGKNVSTRVRLEVVTGATRPLRLRTHLRIVERRDETTGVASLIAESLFLIQPGDPHRIAC